MNDEKTQAAVERLAKTIQGLEIRCENVPTVWDDYQTILAALDAANERAERAEVILREVAELLEGHQEPGEACGLCLVSAYAKGELPLPREATK